MKIKPIYPPTLMCDFYKISHRLQYPKGTTRVYSTWIPRESRIDGVTEVVAFGFQAFIKEFLMGRFQRDFFDRPADDVCAEYERFIKYTLGDPEPDSSHLRRLHGLGYLPLEIRAVPEGTLVPLRVPMLTIENTHPEFFWLTNFLETIFSAEVWQACTSATIALQYRKMFNQYAEETGGDMEFVAFQGHDFSMRGMTSLESAAKSGAGHLLSFSGTDTVPAITHMEAYYNANVENELVGTSIPATEHSVMCSFGQDEWNTFNTLLTETYPSGIFSAVSDTYDLFKVLGETLPALKDVIMARDGKLVIRPDSGDPADIICGTSKLLVDDGGWEEKGVIEMLWDTFGGRLNGAGYKELDPHVGAIYGDSITLRRADDIFYRLKQKGFASTNIVLGIGSYTYQMVTRDTFGFAMKSTWVEIDGQEKNIFKDPKTDSGMKKSLTGRVVVNHDWEGHLHVQDGLSKEDQSGARSRRNDYLVPVYRDGKLLWDQEFHTIKARVLAAAQ